MHIVIQILISLQVVVQGMIEINICDLIINQIYHFFLNKFHRYNNQ